MSVRILRAEELAAAQQIFGAGLDARRVRISEGTQLPNWVGRIGAALKRQPAPTANAITVGNTSYFPVELTSTLRDIGWLMHELTHQWQYQHDGIIYLPQAIFASTYIYTDPGETWDTALKRLSQGNINFRGFNREQQGDVIRDYYFALNQPNEFVRDPLDLTAWEPYLQEIRQPPS